jgi:hypothetical protein
MESHRMALSTVLSVLEWRDVAYAGALLLAAGLAEEFWTRFGRGAVLPDADELADAVAVD